MYKCKICNKDFNKLRDLSIHLYSHNMKLLDYYVEYEKFEIPKCVICGENSKVKKGLIFTMTCSEKCKSKFQQNKTHTEKTKKIISEKRKSYLLLNPDKHPWKRKDKNISEPCEIFKQKLRKNNILFDEEFSPLIDRFYSIDISFTCIKIGIEINGNQHYNSNGELKKYYKDRKDNIEKEGWKLYDIYYTKVYDDDFCESLINNLQENHNISNLNFNFKLSEKNYNYCKCGKVILKNSKLCNKCNAIKNRKVDRPDNIDLIEEVSKNGYSLTGRKYNVSPTTIKRWLHS